MRLGRLKGYSAEIEDIWSNPCGPAAFEAKVNARISQGRFLQRGVHWVVKVAYGRNGGKR